MEDTENENEPLLTTGTSLQPLVIDMPAARRFLDVHSKGDPWVAQRV